MLKRWALYRLKSRGSSLSTAELLLETNDKTGILERVAKELNEGVHPLLLKCVDRMPGEAYQLDPDDMLDLS